MVDGQIHTLFVDDPEQSAAALGYIVLLVQATSNALGLVLPMQMSYGASRSGVCRPGGRYAPSSETECAAGNITLFTVRSAEKQTCLKG